MLNAVTLAYLTSLILPSNGGVCGKASASVGDIRVVGGDAVADGILYPWFVAFMIPESVLGDRPPVVACGGSLITSSHVLTAAHCYIRNRTRGDMAATYKLAYLLKDKCQGRKDFILEPQARSVRLHEGFSPATLRNDIALVTLQRKVAYTPICLPTMRAETSDAVVIGFGSVLPRTVYPCRLQEARVNIYSRPQCLSLPVGKLIQTLPNVLCAGKLQGGVDTCDGDSGGPLQYTNAEGNYVIRGIVSFGNGCGKVGYPGVYTDVTQYLSWIEATVGRGNVPSVGRRPSFWEIFSRPQTNWSAWFNALVSHLNNSQKCQNII